MNNQEYVKKIVSYIRSYMEQNNITQKKLESLCKEKRRCGISGYYFKYFCQTPKTQPDQVNIIHGY